MIKAHITIISSLLRLISRGTDESPNAKLMSFAVILGWYTELRRYTIRALDVILRSDCVGLGVTWIELLRPRTDISWNKTEGRITWIKCWHNF
jgi:hypothetical protein